MTVTLQAALKDRNRLQIELTNVLPAYRSLRSAVHELLNAQTVSAQALAETRLRDLLYETPNI